MRKLLSANFARLWKNKVFWLGTGILFVWSVIHMANGCRQATQNMSDYNYGLDHYYFLYVLLIGVFCAVFTSLFIGSEYSDGTIRNKLVVGHTRIQVYLANLLTCFTATLLMMSAWLLGALTAIPVLGTWKMGAFGLFLYLLLSILLAAANAAIFTLVSMLCGNKATAAVVCILMAFGLLLCGSTVYNRLQAPEMTNNVIITAEEGMSFSEPKPNPDYISGTTRTVYEWILDLLPSGQGIQLSDLAVARPLRMLLLSVFLTAAVTAAGVFFFRKKNLK